MPARRDLFTGRYNFLERNWGGIEPFDRTFPQIFCENGIQNHMITDHTHYVEIGGENYLQQFETWECIRGQEYDHWVSRNAKPELPKKYYGKVSVQYQCNKSRFFTEEEFPTPKTFRCACDWARENKGADNFFLMVEGFDPHEPFDTPEDYLSLYGDDYQGPHYNWSGYCEAEGDEKATKHLQNCYKATITMTDKWLGRFLEALKENDLYEDSYIIFTTDHGHLLGEHGCVGKNVFHAYNELAHLPMFLKLPGQQLAGETRSALTQNIDIMPTLLDLYQLEIPGAVRGHSLLEVIHNQQAQVRQTCIYGWHGSSINITDGRYTYLKAPDRTKLLYNYCAMPSTLWRYLGTDACDKIEMGRFLKHTQYPVYRFEMDRTSPAYHRVQGELLFDVQNDPQQLDYHDAPDELYDRFSLNR